jgi:uncharacterized protein YuzE
MDFVNPVAWPMVVVKINGHIEIVGGDKRKVNGIEEWNANSKTDVYKRIR